MTEPNFSVDFTALTVGTSGAIAKGDALVFDATQGIWLVATTAVRAAADGGAEAIALTAFGGSLVGSVSYQAAGVVAQSVTGLAVLASGTGNKLVRTSAAGRLERISAYTTGDDVVGYAKPNGRVSLHIGLPWEFISAAAAGAALPDYSVQYRTPLGGLGGAATVTVDTTGAKILFGGPPSSASNGLLGVAYSAAYFPLVSVVDLGGTPRPFLSVEQDGGAEIIFNVGSTSKVLSLSGSIANFVGGGVVGLAADADKLKNTRPVVGNASPFSVHGRTAAISLASIATKDLSNVVTDVSLTRRSLRFSGAPTAGSCTVTLYLPVLRASTTADDQTYTPLVDVRDVTGNVVLTVGSGDTLTLTGGSGAGTRTPVEVQVTPNGVYRVGGSAAGANDAIQTSDGSGGFVGESSTLNTTCNLAVSLGGKSRALALRSLNITSAIAAPGVTYTLTATDQECPIIAVESSSVILQLPSVDGAIFYVDGHKYSKDVDVGSAAQVAGTGGRTKISCPSSYITTVLCTTDYGSVVVYKTIAKTTS